VNVQPEDPFALKKYILSDGGQAINTDYVHKSSSRYEAICNFTLVGAPSYPILFGVDGVIGIYAKFTNTQRIYFNSNSYVTLSLAGYEGRKVVAAIESGRCSMRSADGAGFSIWGGKFVDGSAKVSIFEGTGSTNNRVTMRLYRLRIWEGDDLVHEFLPFVDDQDVVCVKDAVTGDLKYNNGSGAFIYGEDCALDTSGWLKSWTKYAEISNNELTLKSGSTDHRVLISPPPNVAADTFFHAGDVFVLAFAVDSLSSRVSVNMSNASYVSSSSATGLMTTTGNGNTYTTTTGNDVLTFTINSNYSDYLTIGAYASDGSSSTSASGKVTVTGMSFNGTVIFGSVTPSA